MLAERDYQRVVCGFPHLPVRCVSWRCAPVRRELRG
jgi:hypothetical protein